ncbi:hypothetical protein [Streptomyces albicerus]|uniref:hypothetical protein n=1 Tax=Streptomyces albicerus TaxID=2569859 RepID=UPI001CED8AF4|nr:hypothetical protein [Streptomyces albicerus]
MTSIRQRGSVSDRFGSSTVNSPAARNVLCRLKAGRKVVEAQAHRVRLGTFEAVLAVQGEQPRPRVEIGGEVRGEHPACVDLTRLRGQVRQPHVLVGADVVFDLGVVAVQCVEELDLVRAGDAPHVSEMFVAVTEYRQPVFCSQEVSFFMCRREGRTRRTISRMPSGQPSRVFR